MKSSVDSVLCNKSTLSCDAKEAVTKNVVNNIAQGTAREKVASKQEKAAFADIVENIYERHAGILVQM
eukprot:14171937-Ditylum_brightwellii.AAC.1